jgi:hypothetical protein
MEKKFRVYSVAFWINNVINYFLFLFLFFYRCTVHFDAALITTYQQMH